MDIKVFTLVLFAAFTHALWNFFSKKASGNLKVTLAGIWLSNLVLLPVSIFIISGQGLSWIAIKYMMLTALSHILYYFCLNMSYQSGDISTVYPVARGTGIAGTAIAAYFILGEKFSGAGQLGITLIVIGVLAISIKKGLKKSDLKPLFYAIGVGFSTVFYSISDKVGVTYANPIVYMNLKDLIALVLMTPFVFKKGIPDIISTYKSKWKYCTVIGFGALGTYLLILFAFTMANAGYVSAVREFSIVIGAVLGIVFLKEKVTPGKILGIVLVVIGLVCIKMS